jgi:hypothetical protein
MGLGGQRHTPAVLSPGKNRYPLYRRLGGSHERSGRVRKNSIPPGFDPRTAQPVASHYIDRDIQAQLIYMCVCVYVCIYIYIYTHTFCLVTEAVSISH